MTVSKAIKVVVLEVADKMHEAVRKFDSLMTEEHLSLIIDLSILENNISFTTDNANEFFKLSVVKELKKGYSRDFRKVFNNINKRVLI